MATNFPASLDDNTSLPIVADNVDNVLAVHQNDPRLAIIAIETKVGIGADTPVAGDFFKGTGTGTSGWSAANLDDLADVNVATPAVDQFLKWNGAEWVASASGNSSAGAATVFFNDDTNIIAVSTNNVNEVNTLTKVPAGGAEVVDTIVVNSNTILGEAYLYNTALGVTSIPAGVWEFDTYAGVSASAGVSEILRNVMKVVPEQGGVTVTMTGTGTSRTATASGGTPFATAKIDTGGTLDSDSYLQTPLGLYRITARTSDTEVTIATPTTYSNESTVAFSVWKRLFQTSTGEINNISPVYELYSVASVQAAFTIALTDKLGSIVFGKTDSGTNKTLSFVHNGTTHYSHFHSTLVSLHNDLPGLQGGTSNEYYHLTSAQLTVATQAATASLNGYMTSVYATKLDGIATGATANAKATAAELDTGTDDAKFATALAIAGRAEKDGWTPARESWSYASASTITVPSGAASKYQKGDRIKWTQTTVRYGTIVAVADTVLTIAVNTDYVVDNAAISANFYSHQSTPLGYPEWFNYTPTVTLPTGATGSNTKVFAKYRISGTQCTVLLDYSAGSIAGTITGTYMSYTFPIDPVVTTYGANAFGAGQLVIGAVRVASVVIVDNTDIYFQRYDGGAFTSWTGAFSGGITFDI